ncbi:MAG: hypothetical protein NVSMB12_02450 [Acidimicrobiales bacterium]
MNLAAPKVQGDMRHTLRWAAALGILDLALAVGLGWPAWAHPASVTVGGRQDAPYIVWAFAWVARAASTGTSPWVTTHLSWPGGVNLLSNATATGLGLVLAPVTRVWGPLVSFNVAATAATAGTAWSAQLVWRRVRGSWPAAGIGGLVAGFGPTALAQTGGGHLHVTAAFLVPPLLLGAGRLASGTADHPRRWGVAIGLLAAAQVLVGEELLAIAAVAAALGVIAAGRRIRWRPLLEGGLVAGLAFAVAAGYPLWVQFCGTAHISGPIQAGDLYRNDLAGFVVPIRQVWLGSGWSAGLLRHFSTEGSAYLGVPLVLVAMVVAFRRRRDPLTRVVAVTAIGLAVLALGSHLVVAGHRTGIGLPWALLAHQPLLESLLPVRFGVALDLAFGALLAVAIDDRPGWRGAAVAVVCLLPLLPALPFRSTRWTVPPFFSSTTPLVRDGALVVVSPYPSQANPAIEVWLAEAGARWRSGGGAYVVPDGGRRVTIGGPVAVADAVDIRLAEGVPAAALAPLRAQVRADLGVRHVDAVIVGPGTHRDEVIRWWTDLLGPPRSTGGVELWPIS